VSKRLTFVLVGLAAATGCVVAARDGDADFPAAPAKAIVGQATDAPQDAPKAIRWRSAAEIPGLAPRRRVPARTRRKPAARAQKSLAASRPAPAQPAPPAAAPAPAPTYPTAPAQPAPAAPAPAPAPKPAPPAVDFLSSG
jgi:hypothetical protein